MSFENYGIDVSCLEDFEEEGGTVTGIVLLAQALVRRWMTPRGMLLDDPDYGTDLREYINEDVDELTLMRIRAEARAEALKDERVVDCTIVASSFDRETGTLSLSMSVEANEGALILTVAVTDLTVELLDVEAA